VASATKKNKIGIAIQMCKESDGDEESDGKWLEVGAVKNR
jgi:hypothetical protein